MAPPRGAPFEHCLVVFQPFEGVILQSTSLSLRHTIVKAKGQKIKITAIAAV